MARPDKNTVDYFPYICEEGQKMFYLEETYGNDGFATFVKILRELAKTNFHYLDLSKPARVMFLCAKCKVSKDILLAIINDLVDLEKFDSVLWKENNIIWCQDFIDSIQDAYIKRKNKCITYEGLISLLISLGVRKLNKSKPVSVNNTQTILEETISEETISEKTILEETKENNILLGKEPKQKPLKSPSFNFKKKLVEYGFNEKLIDDWLAVRKTKKATNTETAFDSFIREIESRESNINEMLQICVTNSWSGFKYKWVDNLNNSQNGKSNTSGNDSQAANEQHKQSAITAVNAMFGIK